MRLLLLVCLLLASSAHAEVLQDSDGLPASGTTINLKPTRAGYEAKIVLPDKKYTGVTLSSSDPVIKPVLAERVEMEEVAAAATNLPADPDKSAASPPAGQLEPAKAPASFAKVVTVLLNRGAIPQGQYRFSLKLEGTAPVTRDLMLKVPASSLDAGDTLIVVSEWAKPGFLGETNKANQPQIWETSQKGWLTHLTLDQKGQTDAGPDPAGRIKPKSGSLGDLAPGGNGLILLGRDYELDGSFPLGIAKGKLVLNADQLSGPVTFNFEVRSRVWVGLLFIPMIIGPLMGYGARTGLASLLAVSQERDKGYDLVAAIDEALRRDKDPDFQAAASTERDNALAAVSRRKVDDIKRQTDDAQTAFERALTALAGRRTELARAIAEFDAVVQAGYFLPKQVRESLERTHGLIEARLTGNAALNNVAAAQEAFEAERLAVRATVLGAGHQWVNAVTDLTGLIEFVESAFGFTGGADLRARLRAFVEPVDTAITQVYRDLPPNTPSTKAALEALHNAIYALQQLRDVVSSAVTQQIVRLEQILGGKPLPRPSDWNDWIRDAKAFATLLRSLAPEDPDVPALANAGTLLPARLRMVLKEQVSDVAAQLQIETLLKDNKVVEAVAKVEELLRPTAQAGVVHESASTQIVNEAAAQQPGVIPALPVISTSYPAGPDAAVIALRQERNRRVIETAGAAQTAIFGLVILGAGYFLFADKWIGTPIDFATVLFWAFATDIGANAATTAAKSLNKAG